MLHTGSPIISIQHSSKSPAPFLFHFRDFLAKDRCETFIDMLIFFAQFVKVDIISISNHIENNLF